MAFVKRVYIGSTVPAYFLFWSLGGITSCSSTIESETKIRLTFERWKHCCAEQRNLFDQFGLSENDISMSDGILLNKLRRKLEALNVSDFHGLISPGLTCYLNCVLQVLFMTEEFRDRIKSCSESATILDIYLKDLFITLEKTQPEHIMFRGRLDHKTLCCKCETVNTEPGFFWMLPLSIKDPHQIYSVDKGFDDFFSKEKVSGENKMYCDKCKAKQSAIVMCEMTQPPEVLTLLLKRFYYDSDLKCNVKIDCEAEIPFTLTTKECNYDLYAMVKHYGTLTAGHYIALIYSSQTKEWYSFNDERVKLKTHVMVSEKTYLRSRSSYLLMYMKRSKISENSSENEGEMPDVEANVSLTNELMDSSCDRGSKDDYKTVVKTLPSKPHLSPNSPKISRQHF
ncbi:hypothetical protein WMY93_014314 [Mugilogobius chulae]|uniref:USP domain-containing protein n=1 Tax=Mugilogobius chulae TaxID=88201 RepID=A0AAW0NYE4_9GOBI